MQEVIVNFFISKKKFPQTLEIWFQISYNIYVALCVSMQWRNFVMLHSTYGFGNNHSALVGRSECSGISALFFNCGRV